MKRSSSKEAEIFEFKKDEVFYDYNRCTFITTKQLVFGDKKFPETFIFINPDSDRQILFKKQSNYRNHSNEIIFWEYVAIRNHRYPCYFIAMNIPSWEIQEVEDFKKMLDNLIKKTRII